MNVSPSTPTATLADQVAQAIHLAGLAAGAGHATLTGWALAVPAQFGAACAAWRAPRLPAPAPSTAHHSI